MSLLPPIFPLAPLEYNQEEERAFRARVSDAIGLRLGKDEIPQYAGVPNTQVSGTNTAFSVPAGTTPTILPFNVIINDTTGDAITFNTGSFAYSVNIEMATLEFFRIRHAAASGGNVEVLITLIAGGTPYETFGYAANLGDTFDISDTFFPLVPPAGVGVPLQLAMTHDHSTPVLVDMTKSKWLFCQLSADKKLIGNERVP